MDREEKGFMRQQDLTVSIIVPVYNSVDYLRACCDSLVGQTYADIEIILVDDGSDDGSAAICDEYACKDSRVHVIHQRNAGHVQARMVGLRNTHGDAVMWMDSDDWADPEWVASFVEPMSESSADVVLTGIEDAVLHKPQSIVDFLLARLDHTLWASCARVECYNGLRFADVTIGEDVLMLQQLVEAAATVRAIPGNRHYHYREVPSSISRAMSLGNKMDWPKRAHLEVEYSREHDPEYVKCAYFDVMRGATLVYRTVKRLPLTGADAEQSRLLEGQLRKLMRRGILHQPLRHMRGREIMMVMKSIKAYLLG